MSHDQFPDSPMEDILDSAESMDEFREKVEAFAHKALEEVVARYSAGERNFSIDYFIDRSKVSYPHIFGPMTYHQWLGRIPLHWFQGIFYNFVNPAIASLHGVNSYADYTTLNPNSTEHGFSDEYVINIKDIMHYSLIVDAETEDPDIPGPELRLLPAMRV
jgi:hypothetical protein